MSRPRSTWEYIRGSDSDFALKEFNSRLELFQLLSHFTHHRIPIGTRGLKKKKETAESPITSPSSSDILFVLSQGIVFLLPSLCVRREFHWGKQSTSKETNRGERGIPKKNNKLNPQGHNFIKRVVTAGLGVLPCSVGSTETKHAF